MSNDIKVKPSVNANDVRQKIKSAFDRNAELEAAHIHVKVTLSGKVDPWHDRDLAKCTAWSAPGVTQVDDQLIVS